MLSSPDESFHLSIIYQNIKEKISQEITEGEVTGAIGILQKMRIPTSNRSQVEAMGRATRWAPSLNLFIIAIYESDQVR